eukprot:TRINITY_DN5844_c0_g1_i1.p2 TRINITY_DN5844_c0_g1~~TRINITY_DN5844_c0_g1_i1.p2  ORF type:complete len:166 (+),score=33.89 TRINITY_DN5844_c0_g1_i1:267-764(+)
MIEAMFNTIKGKRIALLGWAFKKDTGDTRETPAIEIAKGLINEGATLAVYDPKVTQEQIFRDLSMEEFEWDYPTSETKQDEELHKVVSVANDPYEALSGSHALAVITEWDMFKTLDYVKAFEVMVKPAFVFDGRNILDHENLRKLGFIVYAIGKPLDPFLVKSYN